MELLLSAIETVLAAHLEESLLGELGHVLVLLHLEGGVEVVEVVKRALNDLT